MDGSFNLQRGVDEIRRIYAAHEIALAKAAPLPQRARDYVKQKLLTYQTVESPESLWKCYLKMDKAHRE